MHDDAALRRLVSRLRQDLLKLPGELEHFAKVMRVKPDDDNFDPDEQDQSEYFAKRAIENAVYLVGVLLLSTPMLRELHDEFRKLLPENLIKHKWQRYEDELYVTFPAQDVVERFFDLGVAGVGGVISAERLEILDNICAGLGEAVAALVERTLIQSPDRETPIKHLGFCMLKAAFPDAQRDGEVNFRLPSGETRKPDAAIPSLRVCVEFKYANSETELSQRVDEIAADMSAYGDPRYDKFRAVVFAPYDGASNEKLQELLEHKMTNVRPHYEWKAFLVQAAGGRKRRVNP
jgi:hypothetical protein